MPINEALKFPDKVKRIDLHQFPNERVQPIYDDIVWSIISRAGKDEIDIGDALIALAAAMITTIGMAPDQYQQSLRAQMVLRIGSGKGVRSETDPVKIAKLLQEEKE